MGCDPQSLSSFFKPPHLPRESTKFWWKGWDSKNLWVPFWLFLSPATNFLPRAVGTSKTNFWLLATRCTGVCRAMLESQNATKHRGETFFGWWKGGKIRVWKGEFGAVLVKHVGVSGSGVYPQPGWLFDVICYAKMLINRWNLEITCRQNHVTINGFTKTFFEGFPGAKFELRERTCPRPLGKPVQGPLRIVHTGDFRIFEVTKLHTKASYPHCSA